MDDDSRIYTELTTAENTIDNRSIVVVSTQGTHSRLTAITLSHLTPPSDLTANTVIPSKKPPDSTQEAASSS